MNKLIIFVFPLLLSCNYIIDNKIEVTQNDTQIDSLIITESITGRIFISFSTASVMRLNIDSTFIGVLQTVDGKGSFLTIIRPKKSLKIKIKEDSTLLTDHIADSLLNYLWTSQNDFFGKYNNFIFQSDDTDSLLLIYENFKQTRTDLIEQNSNRLTAEDKALLLYQNNERINSFLFHYGKFIKKIPMENSYYSFVDEIENNNKLAKTVPNNLLYKHEINYLLENDTINNIVSFISYIESQTSNNDLSDYLKAFYLKEIIEDPSRWASHQSLLASESFRLAIEQEKENSYYYLIQNSVGSYFASQKGEKAFDFTAERLDGTKLKLSDFKGKLVFIDNWASWCGPCIEHRPFVLKMAERYKDNPKIEVLMISVDESKNKWVKYLTKNDELDQVNDVIIENGMKNEYGEKFNIKHIPKYMLIDQSGVIINSDLPDPSNQLVELIEKELNK